MTKQEYYDLLIRSALNGTFPAGDKSGCYYREGNRKDALRCCPIGLLIPDEVYDSGMEGDSILDVVDFFGSVVEIPKGLSLKKLQTIQDLHDNLCINDNWYSEKFIDRLNSLSCFADVVQTVE